MASTTLTPENLVEHYPVFKDLVCGRRAWMVKKIEHACLLVDADNLGDQTDIAILAKAAQLMARSQCGQDSGLVNDKTGETFADDTVGELLCTFGCRVI